MSKTIEIDGRRIALASLTKEERAFAKQWGDLPALKLTVAKPRFSLPRFNMEKALIAGLLAVAFTAGAASFQLMNNDSAPYARLIATTADGNVYAVGDGDTCKEVYDRDPLPANIVRLECATADGAWNVIKGGL